MSIHKKSNGVFEVRWREGGRNKSQRVHGSYELARKIERKRMSLRDENRHLDIKREVSFRMSALLDRYWAHYGSRKRSSSREKSIIEGIRVSLGRFFVREVDGAAIARWYEDLTAVRGLSAGTAVRHFNVMHHMKGKAPRCGPGKPVSIGTRQPWSRCSVPTIGETGTCPKKKFGD